MTIEKLEALERAKDDPTCSADEFCERCTKLAYAQQAAFPALLAVAKAAKAFGNATFDGVDFNEYVKTREALRAALAKLEATP